MASVSVNYSMRVSGESPQVQGTSLGLQRYLTDPSPSSTERLVAGAGKGQDAGKAANERRLQELEAKVNRMMRDVESPRP
ncbi:hypothetical protein ACHAQA_009117 [Verticillium albo-atrum]